MYLLFLEVGTNLVGHAKHCPVASGRMVKEKKMETKKVLNYSFFKYQDIDCTTFKIMLSFFISLTITPEALFSIPFFFCINPLVPKGRGP
jgi:hypothetical protein